LLAPFEADGFETAHAERDGPFLAFATGTAVSVFLLVSRRALFMRERNERRPAHRVSAPHGPGRCPRCHAVSRRTACSVPSVARDFTPTRH